MSTSKGTHVQRIVSRRNDVVPGSIHYTLASYGAKYRRRPKTIQERRRFVADYQQDNIVVKLRRGRSPRNLPHSYSDLDRNDVKYRGWKDLTKCEHQYELKICSLIK